MVLVHTGNLKPSWEQAGAKGILAQPLFRPFGVLRPRGWHGGGQGKEADWTLGKSKNTDILARPLFGFPGALREASPEGCGIQRTPYSSTGGIRPIRGFAPRVAGPPLPRGAVSKNATP